MLCLKQLISGSASNIYQVNPSKINISQRFSGFGSTKPLWTPRTSTRFFSMQPIQADITNKLSEVFNPVHLEITNESYKHGVPKGTETHFKVVIASDKFKGIPLIEQHRLVNDALSVNLKSGVHALAIKTMTPEKWESSCASNPNEPSSFSTPNCLGGSKHDKKSL